MIGFAYSVSFCSFEHYSEPLLRGISLDEETSTRAAGFVWGIGMPVPCRLCHTSIRTQTVRPRPTRRPILIIIIIIIITNPQPTPHCPQTVYAPPLITVAEDRTCARFPQANGYRSSSWCFRHSRAYYCTIRSAPDDAASPSMKRNGDWTWMLSWPHHETFPSMYLLWTFIFPKPL